MRAERLPLSMTKTPFAAVCLVVACLILVAGCSNSRLRRTPAAAQNAPWFCQLNEARDDWVCIQDADLARYPRPERLPTDIVEPEPAPLPVIRPTVTYESEPSQIGASEGSPVATEPTDIAGTERLPAEADRTIEPSIEPVDLMSLPGDMYAVQLIAVANEPLADDFVREREVGNAMTLMLAREGDLYYVVLLGIYESYADAQTAADHRPSSLANVEPWIRSLASIQKGVQEARSLTSPTE